MDTGHSSNNPPKLLDTSSRVQLLVNKKRSSLGINLVRKKSESSTSPTPDDEVETCLAIEENGASNPSSNTPQPSSSRGLSLISNDYGSSSSNEEDDN